MKTMTPEQLIQAASKHDRSALAKRDKAWRLDVRRFKVQAQIAKLAKLEAALNSQANGLIASAHEHEAAGSELLNEARLAYTAGMTTPSEERATAWLAFFLGVPA